MSGRVVESRWVIALGALALLLVLAVAGCGDGEGSKVAEHSDGLAQALTQSDAPNPVDQPARLDSDTDGQTALDVGANENDPCAGAEGTDDSCNPRVVSDIDLFSNRPSRSDVTYSVGPANTVEEVLEKGLRLAGASPVHVALRGTAIADSVRCDWRGIARTSEQREDAIRFWLGLDEDDEIPDATYLEALFTPQDGPPWEQIVLSPADIEDDPDDSSRFRHPITGLELQKVYAVHVNYAKGCSQSYSAREAFVWPSKRPAGGGERVATFPLNFPVKNKEYAYRICEDGFPVARLNDWKRIIKHALGQWKTATDELVTMTYLENEPCADYGTVMQTIIDRYAAHGNSPLTDAQIELLKTFLKNLDSFTDAKTDDTERNEIIMVDNTAANYQCLREIAVFPELAVELGLAECVFNGIACAVPRHEHDQLGAITDILLPGRLQGEAPRRCSNDTGRR